MSDTAELSDPDFTAQMQGLVQEAKQALEERSAAQRAVEADKEAIQNAEERALRVYQSLPQILRPVVVGLEAVGRVAGEHGQILEKIRKEASEAAEAQAQLPQVIADLRGLVDQKNSVSRQMFDALHEELRTYKDGFLLDAVHRPMIRDLITLFDDLSETHRQMKAMAAELSLAGNTDPILDRFRRAEMHLGHNLDFVLEVLARLEVAQMPIGTGKLEKTLQRAVTVEMTEDPDEDREVVRTVRRGFLWKDRVVRAEEVVVKKWKEGFLAAMQPGKDNDHRSV